MFTRASLRGLHRRDQDILAGRSRWTLVTVVPRAGVDRRREGDRVGQGIAIARCHVVDRRTEQRPAQLRGERLAIGNVTRSPTLEAARREQREKKEKKKMVCEQRANEGNQLEKKM